VRLDVAGLLVRGSYVIESVANLLGPAVPRRLVGENPYFCTNHGICAAVEAAGEVRHARHASGVRRDLPHRRAVQIGTGSVTNEIWS
jgi:hypothetical protein